MNVIDNGILKEYEWNLDGCNYIHIYIYIPMDPWPLSEKLLILTP